MNTYTFYSDPSHAWLKVSVKEIKHYNIAHTISNYSFVDNRIENVLELVNKPLPEVYSSDLSEFIFAAAIEIIKKEKIDLMYLSTTDFIQHKAAPGDKIAVFRSHNQRRTRQIEW